MTPKDKAKELRLKYYVNIPLNCLMLHNDLSKNMALIAVDEILNAISEIFETYQERKYWQEVKKEINKL